MSVDNRVGEIFISNEGCEFIIIEYNRNDDVLIEFQDEFKATKRVTYKNCQKGIIKNPYFRSVHGKGYIGEGEYKPTINNKQTIQYKYWYNCLTRCYHKDSLSRRSTYENCFVDEAMLNFQNFARWFDDNYYEIDDEVMCLDKDILFKGNKVYSFESCIFVPQRINTLFLKSDAIRGNLPLGVYYREDHGKYIAQCNIVQNNKRTRKYLGSFNTPNEAFATYKKFKEDYIKTVAKEYEGRIPKKLYDALMVWEVEITD